MRPGHSTLRAVALLVHVIAYPLCAQRVRDTPVLARSGVAVLGTSAGLGGDVSFRIGQLDRLTAVGSVLIHDRRQLGRRSGARLEIEAPAWGSSRIAVGVSRMTADPQRGTTTDGDGEIIIRVDSATSRIDTVRRTRTSTGQSRPTWSAVTRVEGRHFGVDWSLRSWHVFGELSRRSPRTQASFDIGRRLGPTMDLIGAISTPNWHGSRARPVAIVGLRFVPLRPPTPSVRDLRWAWSDTLRQSVRITVRARGGRRVELKGSLTQWRSVALSQLGNGPEWITDLQAHPGVHRVQVRIDGGDWIAPPELPLETSEFGGSSGLLIIPPDS